METIQQEASSTKKIGIRHFMILLLFVGVSSAYMMRVCMSVAIVAMRNKESANPDFPEYDWNTETTGMILSSFYWGFLITQLPSGYILNYYSPSKLLSYNVFLSSIFNLCIPFIAGYGTVYVISCRVAMGLCQGCVLPAAFAILAKWAPPLERALLSSIVASGVSFSFIVAMPVSGILAASSFGWPSIFYFFSAIGITWSIVFYFLATDSPSVHPIIDEKEVKYINSSLGKSNKIDNNENKLKVPWKALLTSLPTWAIVSCHGGHSWGFVTLLTEMPAYIKNVLNFDTSQSGLLSALPYIGFCIVNLPLSYLADLCLRKGVSTLTTRKIFNTIGFWIPALSVVIIALANTNDATIIVAILVIAVAFSSAINGGYVINCIDLSPNFSGTIVSFSTFLASIVGIITPLICGIIVFDEKDEGQWKIVFYISGMVQFVTSLIFLIFAKADIQSWNSAVMQSVI